MLEIINMFMNIIHKILKPFLILLIGTEIIDEVMDSNLNSKLQKSRVSRFIDRIINELINMMFRILFHMFMIALTGGLWIFWLMYKQNKKRKRA